MAIFEALSDFCSDRKAFADTEDRNTLQNSWAKYLKIYRNYISGNYGGISNIHIPQTFATTFRLYSAIMSNIRRNREVARFVATPKHDATQIDSLLAQEAMQQAAEYYTAKGRLLREIGRWELESSTLGTSFIKTAWEYEEVESPGRELEDGTRLLEPAVSKDGIKFEHRPIYTMFIDPKCWNKQATVDDLEFIIDQKYMSIDELFSNPKFFNKEEVHKRKTKGRIQNKKAEMREDTTMEQAIDQIMGIGGTGVETRDNQSDQILVEEYWGRVPQKLLTGRNKKGYDNSDLYDFVEAYVVLAQGVVVWAQNNPYPNERKPYDVIRCYSAPNMFYGIGIPELIEPLQRAMNAVTNQRIDNVSLVLNRMWAYRRNQVNPKHLISRPGGFIPVRGPVAEALMPIVTQDVTNSAYREHDIYDNAIQKVSGVADIFFGHSGKSTKISATEATFMTEMGAGMMEEIVANQVQDGFIPMMEKVRDYIQAFNTEPLPLSVDGQIQSVTPEMLSGEFVLVPSIGEQMFTKTAEMQKATMLLETTLAVQQQLMMEGKAVRTSKILERIYDNAGWKDFSTIVVDAPQGGQAAGQEAEEGAGTGVLGAGNGGAGATAADFGDIV